MEKGIYIAISGAIARQKALEIGAQNLANAQTIGYKRETLSFKSLLFSEIQPELLLGKNDERRMNNLETSFIDFTHGSEIKTGIGLDLAIEGDGFFSIEGGFYTRKGSFKINRDGYLVTQDGKKVLGNGQPINLPQGNIVVKEDGRILVNGIESGKIDVVDFENKSLLQKAENGYFVSSETSTQINPKLMIGYLEQSNINVINEMVSMINYLREYETYQKAVQTFDTITDKAVNEMTRI